MSPSNQALSKLDRRRLPSIGSDALAIAAVTIIALIQLELVFSKSINWDETFHWSQVYAANRGADAALFQRAHVHLFSWLPGRFDSAFDEIRLARLLLWPLLYVAAWMIYDISRRFASRQVAIVSALAYVTGGYVYIHSFAVRADMVAGTLITFAVWALLTRPVSVKWIAIAGAAFLLAFLATIKSLLLLPSVGVIALWRWREGITASRILQKAGILAGVLALAALMLLLVLRSDFQALALNSFDRMFQVGLSPNVRYFVLQALHGPLYAALFLATLYAILARKEATLPQMLAFAFLLPLAIALVYRNSFPYFFAFLLPLPSIAAVAGAKVLVDRYGYGPLMAFIILSAIIGSLTEDRSMTSRQEYIQAGIRQVFPEPVTYIDDVGLLPDYPRAVDKFASGWAQANYRASGDPVYAQALEARTVPMLLRSGYALETMTLDPEDEYTLLIDDQRALLHNFIPHWGKLYVAGKVIAPADGEREEYFAVPGTYTVEGAPITIEGHIYMPGDYFTAERATHSIVAAGDKPSTLRWGRNLPVPAGSFPEKPIFTHF